MARQQVTKASPAANFDALPDSAFVRLPVVCALFSISQPTAWRWVKKGLLPKPRKLGPRVAGFQVAAVRRALASHGGAR
jgi:predicted DNA-binding transcriptional regulator AlpA